MPIQVQNHWFFSCITVVFGFELIRSVPWIPLPTSLAWEPEWNLWIERSRLFCYSVINLLRGFQRESFYILSHHFVFVKNFFNLFFSKLLSLTGNLFIITHSNYLSRTFLRNSYVFLSKAFILMRNDWYNITLHHCRQHFFHFFLFFFSTAISLFYLLFSSHFIELHFSHCFVSNHFHTAIEVFSFKPYVHSWSQTRKSPAMAFA